ncbi:MAG: carboxypeptidase, partial [Bacteroidota bacterium]
MKRILLLSLITLFSSISLLAQEEEKKMGPIPAPDVSETPQRVVINGATINLTAQAGTFKLRDENNEPIALFG